jgi:hypothetical protein
MRIQRPGYVEVDDSQFLGIVRSGHKDRTMTGMLQKRLQLL